MPNQSAALPSLRDLAIHNKLPQFQHMDKTTWNWINQNNPHFETEPFPATDSFYDWFQALRIPQAWFLEKRIIHATHGLRHLWRSAYYSLYLARILALDEVGVKQAIIASLLHDIRRENDKNDPGHGNRSADWFRSHAAGITSQWHINLSPEDITTISIAISLHEVPYCDFSPMQADAYQKYKAVIDIVKTADALDRYRMPKLTWWINDDHLRLIPSQSLRQLAFEAVLDSEGHYLQSTDSLEALGYAFSVAEKPSASHTTTWSDVHFFYPRFGELV